MSCVLTTDLLSWNPTCMSELYVRKMSLCYIRSRSRPDTSTSYSKPLLDGLPLNTLLLHVCFSSHNTDQATVGLEWDLDG